jgi:hypothetical protein
MIIDFYLCCMPHYRMTIKLENKNVQEFIIEDPRNQIEFVYLEYRKRVYQKNGAGRVTYFDLVMLAEESLKHQEDRKEVFNEQNNFGLTDSTKANKDYTISRKKAPRPDGYKPQMTLGERAKYNRK